ncbi:MAG: hypothetical protein H7Y88_00295 [Phycisphaerales bacterium]|nr:hypothetical protein [Phycisphaerales bacterium]
MAKGQHLSAYQQKIVKRYYEHLDSATTLKLQELVSDLYLASDAKASARLWKSARAALIKTGVEEAKIEKLASANDVKGLASLVGELSALK